MSFSKKELSDRIARGRYGDITVEVADSPTQGTYVFFRLDQSNLTRNVNPLALSLTSDGDLFLPEDVLTRSGGTYPPGYQVQGPLNLDDLKILIEAKAIEGGGVIQNINGAPFEDKLAECLTSVLDRLNKKNDTRHVLNPETVTHYRYVKKSR
jgi:hypothetical protein